MKIWKTPVAIILIPFSFIYGIAVSLRRRFYRHGWIRSYQLPVPVISIGNITLGGTGKTPMTEMMARKFFREGYRVGIVSRGYARKSRGIVVVSDGNFREECVRTTGDEPWLLSKCLPGVVVVVGANRYEAGLVAVDLGCNLILLDDGFQHLRLRRDLDVVLIDRVFALGNGRLLPAGPLRESKTALQYADIVVMTRFSEGLSNRRMNLQKWIQAPIYQASHAPIGWETDPDSERKPLTFLRHKRVLAFSGIGNPESFQSSLVELDVHVVKFIHFKDHHWYCEKDFRRLMEQAEHLHAEMVVTTEKDWIKIREWNQGSRPIYYLKVDMAVIHADQYFKDICTRLPERGL